MIATDELRRLLDERGVEYTFVPEDAYSREYIKIGNIEIRTNNRDEVAVYHLTPEQAVEATLGGGTCNADETDTWECVRDDLGGYGKTLTVHVMECTECGHTYEHVNGSYEFCPRCGRKVVNA